MSYWIEYSSISRMINRLANPLPVKQAPDARALNKTTMLSIASEALSTPPTAQQYFEPGVNTKLNRRSKPKTNYTLPSDMPEYPLGFVPTNKTPGANGEEPSIVPVKEAVPVDLLQVFARINAEQKLAEAQPKYGVDMGSRIMQEYNQALKEVKTDRKMESMMREGFTQTEAETAMNEIRAEEAKKVAKQPAKPVSVQTALAETFGIGVGTDAPSRGEMEVQTELSMAGGKEIYARKPRGTAEEVAMERAAEEVSKGTQSSIKSFFSKK